MKKSIITKVLLMSLVTGCVVVAPGSVFVLGALVKLIQEAQYAPAPLVPLPIESNPKAVRQSLYRLEKSKYFKIKQVGKTKFKFELTKKGRALLAKYNFPDFTIKPKQSWDGKWRIFVFDVPEKKRATRDMLRDKLKKMGFFQFQKSVWIFPFECEEEMNYICDFLEVQPYTLMFIGDIYSDILLKKYFVREGILNKSDAGIV